jgi:hypothetical protein
LRNSNLDLDPLGSVGHEGRGECRREVLLAIEASAIATAKVVDFLDFVVDCLVATVTWVQVL